MLDCDDLPLPTTIAAPFTTASIPTSPLSTTASVNVANCGDDNDDDDCTLLLCLLLSLLFSSSSNKVDDGSSSNPSVETSSPRARVTVMT